MDGWVNVSGTVAHHTTAGTASPVVTWEPAGLERLSRDTLAVPSSPGPLGSDEQTRFIPSLVLTAKKPTLLLLLMGFLNTVFP